LQDIEELLNHAVHLRSGTAIHSRLMRVLPFLTYVNSDKMSLVIRHFEDVLAFEKFDAEHSADDDSKVEAFVAMCEGIERNQIGNTMKTQMLEMGIVEKCVTYLQV
jgi:E3 ubiquitin-protein ligase UBR4